VPKARVEAVQTALDTADRLPMPEDANKVSSTTRTCSCAMMRSEA